MNAAAESVLDGDMQLLLAVGAGLFLVGLLLCLRRTRFGRQIAQPSTWIWRSVDAELRLEIPEPLRHDRLDGFKIFGIGLLGVGYVTMGMVLLFVAPGWGALAFATGFVGIAAVALWRARG